MTTFAPTERKIEGRSRSSFWKRGASVMENHSRLHDEKCKTPEPFLKKGLGQTVALFCCDSLIFTVPLASSLFIEERSVKKRILEASARPFEIVFELCEIKYPKGVQIL